MSSKPFSLNAADFAKGVALAVIVAALGGLQQLVTAHGFDFASYDWGFIANLAISAFIGYLGKNFISNEQGQVLTPVGKIG